MKKILIAVLCLVLIASCIGVLAACNKKGGNDAPTGYDYDAISDNPTSADGKYEIAFVTDVGQLKDKSFNQGTWEGIKRYAYENGKSYKYYQPANGDQATNADRVDAMNAAIQNGAQIVVAAGFMQADALITAATAHPEVKFVFIDGWPLTDENDQVLTNVAPIDFQEEQSGYLAGYAVVMEGYTKLGFSGGGGGTNPACCRFGYGFVQGAEAAAAALGKTGIEIKYTWLYGTTFSPSQELLTLLNGWYSAGTQVVFSCGGSICKNAFAAASAHQGKVVGVDVDQSAESTTVITSATKGLRESVMFALDKFYSNKFNEIGGQQTTLGAAKDAVGLPTATWSLTNFSLASYNELYAKLKNGTVVVDKNYANLQTTYAHLTVQIVE